MKRLVLILLLFGLSKLAIAQINPMGATYYLNRYILNPAMAGIETGWTLNAAYKAQWTAINGAPQMGSFTADFGSIDQKVGVGANFYSETAGVINRTSFKGTFAYHLPLAKDNKSFVDFGLSGGVMNEWIDFTKVRGDVDDVQLRNFNQRALYFDGDFGAAYRNQQLTIQGSLPNLKRFFKRDVRRNVADLALFFTAISYKFNLDPTRMSTFEPLVSYRNVQNYKDIVDIGANFEFNDSRLMLTTIYHSTNSVTFGAGTNYQKKLSIIAQYTSNTSDLGNMSNGEFEVGLRYKFSTLR